MGKSSNEQHRVESVPMIDFRWEVDDTWTQVDADEVDGFHELDVASVEQVALYVDGRLVATICGVLVPKINAAQIRRQHEEMLIENL